MGEFSSARQYVRSLEKYHKEIMRLRDERARIGSDQVRREHTVRIRQLLVDYIATIREARAHHPEASILAELAGLPSGDRLESMESFAVAYLEDVTSDLAKLHGKVNPQ